ncbi:protein ALP1-like isoform X2 [Monomorium pharaonis]|uniref:protein ALP1-like isoform X2 n=1 Tax=Monomorium pharaonis TaxID=307658 RepID=UPI0017460B0F|nr:protein ALP1-like isoform X2 [Monomorium pharaonis]XP_036150002.1 protein ALP1-like isoform X2 [Monomorium pharaonis]
MYCLESLEYSEWYKNYYLPYYEWYIECCTISVNNYINNEVNRKRKAAITVALLMSNKKKQYKKKKYWIAPILNIRETSGFFNAVFPTLRLEDLRFHNYLRMSATQLENLLQIVGADLYKQYVIREPIETAQRLVLTLRFLASGDSITSMSYQYLVGITTAANIIYETCEAIWKNMQPIVLPSKINEEKWIKISEEFDNKWDFPHCIGAIDGKHIVIQCPRNAGSSYYNYKGSHSIVLLAVCTASYICSFVDIGSHGRRSDGASPAFNNGPTLPYCIVGDEAFPLKPFLLRPYPGKNVTTQEKQVFNFRLARARRTIENTFGIISSRWRIFRKPILSNPRNVIQITQAVICLHNWLRIEDLENEELKSKYVTTELVDRENEDGIIEGSWRRIIDDGSALQDINRIGNNASTREAFEIREKFCDYFNNEGLIAWQYNYL